MYTIEQLESMKNDELKAICRDMKCKRYSKLDKKSLVNMIIETINTTDNSIATTDNNIATTDNTTDNIATTDKLATNIIDKEKLTFAKYRETHHIDTLNFLNELTTKKDVDEVELFCQEYITDKKNEYSDSTIKKFTASIRNTLIDDKIYLSSFFSEDLLNDDLIHVAYKFVKLPDSDYENLTKRDDENRIKKIDNKVELTDNVILEYLTKSVQYLNQRENYKLVVCAIYALTARRFIEVFRLITDFDVDEKYTLIISRKQLAKNKSEDNDLLTCYCLCDSEMLYNALNWLRNESPLKTINEELKDFTNDEIDSKFNTTFNDTIKKYYDFLPSPSTKHELSQHHLRSISTCLLVHLFTQEKNDVDLFLKKCLGHIGNSAKENYKAYYVSSKSQYYRGYLLDNTIDAIEYMEVNEGETMEVNEGESVEVNEGETMEVNEGESVEVNDDETIVIGSDEEMVNLTVTKMQYETIEQLGGLEKILMFGMIDKFKSGDVKYRIVYDSVKDGENIEDNETIDTIENIKNDEFNGYKQYHKIKDCIDKIKIFNSLTPNDEDKLMLTSTLIYQYTGVRTDTISKFRSETKYGDFDSYNNQFNFRYRQNANKDVKKLLSQVTNIQDDSMVIQHS